MKKLLVLLLALAPLSAFASVDSIQKDEDTCMAAARSNLDMKICAGTAYQAADKELNDVYGNYVTNLKTSIIDENKNGTDPKTGSTEVLRRLVASERAWITYRDTTCDFAGTSMIGGTGESLEITGCLVTTTLDRIKFINEYANGPL